MGVGEAMSGPEIYIQVQVYDPVKVSDLLTSHVSYKVRTVTNSRHFLNAESQVNRRYSDFHWLYRTLELKYPGIIVPSVPEKHIFGRYTQEFIELRRTGLQTFLKKVASHPTLSTDSNLVEFLQNPNFQSHLVSSGGEGDKGVLKGLFSAISHSFPVQPAEVDKWFEEQRQFAETLEVELRTLQNALEELLKKKRDISACSAELESVFGELASIGACDFTDLHPSVYDCGDCSELLKIYSTVDEHRRLQGSFKSCLNARGRIHRDLEQVRAVQGKVTSASDALKKSDSLISEEKMKTLKLEREQIEKKLAEQEELFSSVSASIKEEAQMFDREKLQDFKSAAEQLINESLDRVTKKIEVLDKVCI